MAQELPELPGYHLLKNQWTKLTNFNFNDMISPTQPKSQERHIFDALIIFLITCIVFYALYKFIKYLVMINKLKNNRTKKNKDSYTDIITTETVQFSMPPNNMICSYSFDIDVFFQNSSKVIHTIIDRQSPVIKLNMSTGAFVIEYLSAKKPEEEEEEEEKEEEEDKNFENENDASCDCPTGSSSTGVKGNVAENYPTLLRVVTPGIHFQKTNHIEIKQNIRKITIFVNGKFFYSTTLDFVPYLYKGNAILLPNEAWKSIKLRNVNFNGGV